MKEALEHWLSGTRQAPDFVVWAGAGYGGELDLVRRVGAGSLVILEPHGGLHERLARRVDDGGKEMLLQTALWHETGRHRFHQLNDPLRSTLLDPGEQLAGRPNLRVVAEVEVETRSLDDLLDEAGCQGDGLLVLDACGAEPGIIEGASDACLQRFAAVLLRGPDSGYPVGGDAAGLLRQRGFVRPAPAPGNQGDWKLLVRDIVPETTGNEPGHQGDGDPANPGAEQERKDRDGRNDAAISEIRARDARIAELEAELIERAAERDAVTVRLGAIEQDLARLAGERKAADARAEQTEVRLQAQEKDQASLIAERDAAMARATEMEARIGSLNADVARLAAERDAHMRQGSAWQAERDRANAELAESRARVAKLETELAEVRQALTLSVKLQSQHHADLRELQERYREAQSLLERQRTLLARLGERLGAASKYFHELADQHSPDTDSAEPGDSDDESVISVTHSPGDGSNDQAAQRPPTRKSRGKGPAKPRKR